VFEHTNLPCNKLHGAKYILLSRKWSVGTRTGTEVEGRGGGDAKPPLTIYTPLLIAFIRTFSSRHQYWDESLIHQPRLRFHAFVYGLPRSVEHASGKSRSWCRTKVNHSNQHIFDGDMSFGIRRLSDWHTSTNSDRWPHVII
jgi:hypothetical protein